MDQTLLHNMLGTAYNVLLEQEHPDIEAMGHLLREHGHESLPERKDDPGLYDLRYRDANGFKLKN